MPASRATSPRLTGARCTLPEARRGRRPRGAARAVSSPTPVACRRYAAASSRHRRPRPTPAWMGRARARRAPRDPRAGRHHQLRDARARPADARVRRPPARGAHRRAFHGAGETLTLLNDQELELAPDLLLVTDETGPVALAGVMGGEHPGRRRRRPTCSSKAAYSIPAVIQGKARVSASRAMPATASSAASIRPAAPRARARHRADRRDLRRQGRAGHRRERRAADARTRRRAPRARARVARLRRRRRRDRAIFERLPAGSARDGDASSSRRPRGASTSRSRRTSSRR